MASGDQKTPENPRWSKKTIKLNSKQKGDLALEIRRDPSFSSRRDDSFLIYEILPDRTERLKEKIIGQFRWDRDTNFQYDHAGRAKLGRPPQSSRYDLDSADGLHRYLTTSCGDYTIIEEETEGTRDPEAEYQADKAADEAHFRNLKR